MNVQFLSLNDKRLLFDSIMESDNRKLLAEDVINEIDRLENAIRNYEIQMEQIVNVMQKTSTFKQVQPFKH